MEAGILPAVEPGVAPGGKDRRITANREVFANREGRARHSVRAVPGIKTYDDAQKMVGLLASDDGVQRTARPTELALATFVEVGILPAVEPGVPPGGKDRRITANGKYLQIAKVGRVTPCAPSQESTYSSVETA